MPTLNKLRGTMAGMGDTMYTTISGETHDKQKATVENKPILDSCARMYADSPQTLVQWSESRNWAFFFVEFGDGTILLRRSSSASGLRKLMMIRGQDECRERLKIPCGKPAAHCKRATLENIYLPAKSRTTTFLFSGFSRVGDQTSIQSRICG